MILVGAIYLAVTYDVPWAALAGVVVAVAVAAAGMWLLVRADRSSDIEVKTAVEKIVAVVDAEAPAEQPVEESILSEIRILLADKDRRDGRRQWAFYLLGIPTGIVVGLLTPAAAAWFEGWFGP